METRLAMRMYQEYTNFFKKAERERRWNVFEDIPWDKVNKNASEELALCAETFCGVEMYLPDYVAGGINVVRKSFGQAWFQANWAYEESKHALVADRVPAAQRQAHRRADGRLSEPASSRRTGSCPSTRRGR